MKQGAVSLDEILAVRRRRLEESVRRVPLRTIEGQAANHSVIRNFPAAIAGPALRVIAELKRASPTRGLLCQNYRRREIARSYEAAGAAALSVLTEEEFFLGSLGDLVAVRNSATLPVLRKDFIFDRYQIYESAAAGADAVLLIAAVLKGTDLALLQELAAQLQMAALVEIHTEEELKRALDAGARMIGVNNRNLKTMEVRLETSLDLRDKIPARCLAISESGIKTTWDLWRIASAGFNAALIGEHLMATDDPGGELARLLESVKALPAATARPAK